MVNYINYIINPITYNKIIMKIKNEIKYIYIILLMLMINKNIK